MVEKINAIDIKKIQIDIPSFLTSDNNFTNKLANSSVLAINKGVSNNVEELDLFDSNFADYLESLDINNVSIVGEIQTLYSLDDLNNIKNDKVQNFAITDIGTENELYWYSYQTYDSDRCVNTNVVAYKRNEIVYSAVLLGGGEGQSFDVVKTLDGYTIYTGSMAVADENATGRPYGITKFNISDDELGVGDIKVIDVRNSGVKIVDDTTEISYDEENGIAAIRYGYKTYFYKIDNETAFEDFDFSKENAFLIIDIPEVNYRQGGEVYNNKYYYLYGNNGSCSIACIDFSDPNNIKYVYGNNASDNYLDLHGEHYDGTDSEVESSVSKKVAELYKEKTGNDIKESKVEPEGIKVYNENGQDIIYVGFRVTDLSDSSLKSIIVKFNSDE